jgi:hypothetical protein
MPGIQAAGSIGLDISPCEPNLGKGADQVAELYCTAGIPGGDHRSLLRKPEEGFSIDLPGAGGGDWAHADAIQ